MGTSWSITLQPYQPPALTDALQMELPFLKVGITISQAAASALRAAGALYWAHALMPMHPMNLPPSLAAWLPPPAPRNGADDSCAVTTVQRLLHGRPCELYASLVEVPDGVYLEVLGRCNGAPSTADPSTGAWSSIDWVRAVLRLVVVNSRST